MTPEQLEDIREWGEWGDTTPSHMVHALLDHIDTLTNQITAARDLHQPRPDRDTIARAIAEYPDEPRPHASAEDYRAADAVLDLLTGKDQQ